MGPGWVVEYIAEEVDPADIECHREYPVVVHHPADRLDRAGMKLQAIGATCCQVLAEVVDGGAGFVHQGANAVEILASVQDALGIRRLP